MSTINNSKFPSWLKIAKTIIEDEPDTIVAFNDKELIDYINYNMPLQFKLSYSYIIQLLYHDQSTTSTISLEMEQVAIQLRAWWDHIHSLEQLKLYKRLKTNDKSYGRELSILERRFKRNWQKTDGLDLKADGNINHAVNITFKRKGE